MHDHNLARLERLQTQLQDVQLTAMLVTNGTNVSYLTGFSGDSSYLLVTQTDVTLISDTRYETQIAEECEGLKVTIRSANMNLVDATAELIRSQGCRQIGFEATTVTKSLFGQFEAIQPVIEWVSTEGWIEELRAVKDEVEIAAIRNSISVNEQAFGWIREQLAPEHTERQIAHDLEHQMRALGASHCAFDPIVGVGPRAALPHAVVTRRQLSESPFVLIDWGAKVDHYMSDLTRVLVTTEQIPDKLREIYGIVLKAQMAAIEAIRPGASFQDVDHAARGVIDSAGYGDYFGHGLGHGFGLEIHENPFLSPIAEGQLKTNMVITIEPGIYLPEWGGVRIEDDVLVTHDGFEVMSSITKQLDECVVSF